MSGKSEDDNKCKDYRLFFIKKPLFSLAFISKVRPLYPQQVVTFDCTTNPATVDEKRHKFMPKCIGSEEKITQKPSRRNPSMLSALTHGVLKTNKMR
jgi:hypothetical protein